MGKSFLCTSSLDNELPVSLRTNMKVISAYMLAVVGGNDKPSADDVAAILSSVGVSLGSDESAQLDSLIADMESQGGQAAVLEAGLATLDKCPGASGGGGGSSGAAAAATADAGGDAKAEEKKKESSSEDMGGGGGMFDEDY